VGTSEISFGGKLREVMVAGTVSQYVDVRHMAMAQGRFLAPGDWRRGAAEAVIGAKVRDEIFGANPSLGQLVRIGDRRFRIVGVLAASGQGLGMNTDELVFVPVSLAQAMFNSNTLFRILIEAHGRESIEAAKVQVADIIKLRHEGEQDVTVITQDAVLATFDRLLGALTLGVAGIAAISLAVAGILVMNVMLVSVSAAYRRDWPAQGAGCHGWHDSQRVFDRSGHALAGRCRGGLFAGATGCRHHPAVVPDLSGLPAGLGRDCRAGQPPW
jgi:putative ABC transport system permease protein